MMTTVLLYGPLRAKFGKRWVFDVENPAEAIRALCSQAKGFRQHLMEHSLPGYHLLVDGQDIGTPENLQIGGGRVVKLIPVVQGAKSAVWTVLIGVALVAFAMTNPFGIAAIGTWGGGTLGSLAGYVGTSLILGGISQLLFAPPKQKIQDAGGTPNYAFTGPVNTAAQGHPVPICYGRLRVGSAVISVAYHVNQYGSNTSSGGDSLAVTVDTPVTWTSGTIALSATGGTAPYTWSMVSDPSGVFAVVGSTITVVGTPGIGTYLVIVQVEDSAGASVTATLEIACNGAAPSAVSSGRNPVLVVR